MKTQLLLGLSTSMCLAQAKPGPAEAGPEIIAEASAKLIAALSEAIAKEGAANAIEVCSERAPLISAEVGKARGVTLRRASDRPRNAGNAATEPWKLLIAAFASGVEKQEPPRAQLVSNPDHSTTYFAPILISSPLCLQCHGVPGRDIAPETLTAIRKLYPDDKATGYEAGDLRGIWVVTFRAEN